MTDEIESAYVRVGTLQELTEKGVIVITALDRPVAVFAHDGGASAIDNRCPHMGFPLHRGTVKEGLVTCHWHEARFDLKTGCTFDLFADDVPGYQTRIEEGIVYVSRNPRHVETKERHTSRLHRGLEHNIPLIQAKSLIGLRHFKVEWNEILRVVAGFASRHSDTWGEGLTLVTIVSNLLPHLSPETAFHAMARASSQVSQDCHRSIPRRDRKPLESADHSTARLGKWFQQWVQSRHRDGAERVLLTAIQTIDDRRSLLDFLFSAVSNRIYAAQGHVFDFANKACELLDAIGWDLADSVLPLLIEQIVMSRGAEENAHWHHPIEIVQSIRDLEQDLERVSLEPESASSRQLSTSDLDRLIDVLLGDDPLRILSRIRSTLIEDKLPAMTLTRILCYVAARRLAQFAASNEVSDWLNPRHTFIYLNAVHQVVKQNSSPGIVRSAIHGAISVYMDRFLNVPAAALPGKQISLPIHPTTGNVRSLLMETLDRRADMDRAGGIVASYVRAGHPLSPLIDAVLFCTVREDLDFHATQVLEAAVCQSREWPGRADFVEHIFVGVIRQLAAFCPTPRAGHQVSSSALRLSRGDLMYE